MHNGPVLLFLDFLLYPLRRSQWVSRSRGPKVGSHGNQSPGGLLYHGNLELCTQPEQLCPGKLLDHDCEWGCALQQRGKDQACLALFRTQAHGTSFRARVVTGPGGALWFIWVFVSSHMDPLLSGSCFRAGRLMPRLALAVFGDTHVHSHLWVWIPLNAFFKKRPCLLRYN